MRLFSPDDQMDDSGIGGEVTSKHDDVTSTKLRRQNIQSELFAIGIDISRIKSPLIVRRRASSDPTMSDLNKKLEDLEKRTASLQLLYDDLLDRASDLEIRAHKCEEEFSQKKASFDIVEFLIKQDGRSKAMFDHVSLFFYVLITKLRRRGIKISSTTELWTRLRDSDVKSAFESTVKNLGFSNEEIDSLNMILDTLQDRDLTVNVNQTQVDTNNLTAKLHDLSSEFTVDLPIEGDDDNPSNVTNEPNGGGATAVCDTSHTSDYGSTTSTNQSATSGSGDSYDVDCLLLYLQIQKDLDPLVKSALRRAVAVAHCARVPESVTSTPDTTLHESEDQANLDIPEPLIHASCLDDSCRVVDFVRSDECKEVSQETPIRIKNFRPHVFDEIESDDDFMDMVTSTPKPLKPKSTQDLNISNNALEIDQLFGQVITKSTRTFSRRPNSLEIPNQIYKQRSPENKVSQQRGYVSDEPETGLNTLSRIETLISSQRSSTPEEGKELANGFRSFYKRRLKKKTKEIVRAERESIKALSSPLSTSSNESKHPLRLANPSVSQEYRSPTPKIICEVYEVDEDTDYLDSECTSASSSLLSSFYFPSDNGSSLNPTTDEERSISLHEELSELGFFTSNNPRDFQANSEDTLIDVKSQTGSESGKSIKEHVNFFASPNSNPYAYDFDCDYYMLWPGQEMEIELKDLSCDIRLDGEIADQEDLLVIVERDEKTNELERSNHSFTSSLMSGDLSPPTASKHDKWLLG